MKTLRPVSIVSLVDYVVRHIGCSVGKGGWVVCLDGSKNSHASKLMAPNLVQDGLP